MPPHLKYEQLLHTVDGGYCTHYQLNRAFIGIDNHQPYFQAFLRLTFQ